MLYPAQQSILLTQLSMSKKKMILLSDTDPLAPFTSSFHSSKPGLNWFVAGSVIVQKYKLQLQQGDFYPVTFALLTMTSVHKGNEKSRSHVFVVAISVASFKRLF